MMMRDDADSSWQWRIRLFRPRIRGLLLAIGILSILLQDTAATASASTTSSSSSNNNNVYDFEKLTSLVQRLNVLENAAEQTLVGFYEPHLCSFSVKPGILGSSSRESQKGVCDIHLLRPADHAAQFSQCVRIRHGHDILIPR